MNRLVAPIIPFMSEGRHLDPTGELICRGMPVSA